MPAAQGQVSDSITLEPINPAANRSVCPGQNVTLNCTIVRTVNNVPNVLQPSMSWIYRETISINSAGLSENPNDLFGAVFISGNYTLMTIATIFRVPLSHHNSVMECQTSIASGTRRISVAGMTSLIDQNLCTYNDHYYYYYYRCSKFYNKFEHPCNETTSSINMASSF